MMKTIWNSFAVAVAAVGLSAAAFGQAAPAAAAGTTASLHGHVNNAAGVALAAGDVKLTTDRAVQPTEAKFPYDFPLSATGDYKGAGIAPGDYLVYVFADGKYIDRMEVKLAAGDDKQQDFDMTREDYLKNLTPEERKQIEEYKKQNEATTADNKVIQNLNATLTAVRADLKTATPNYDKDVADMKQATDAKPTESILWIEYGNSLAGQAGKLAADDHKAGKPVTSDEVAQKEYADATDAFKKGVDLNAASKKPSPADQATAYNQMGAAFAAAGKPDQAQAAYESAAKLQPANAGQYYGNEAAVLYNAAQSGNPTLYEPALASADKAIDADPSRPDPYFVKGMALVQKATVVNGNYVLPEGCEDAFQHYLSIAPTGKFSGQVRELLAGLNIKVNTSYRAPATSKKK